MYWNPLPAIGDDAAEYLRGRWEERNWRNVPGPIYGAATDTCWTGRLVAPEHVLYDGDYGQEFVYRQPRNLPELRRLLDAAQDEVYNGYAADGDSHWTPGSVRDWWRDRARPREWAAGLAVNWVNGNEDEVEAAGGLRDFVAYIDGELEADLRGYLFWLLEREIPERGETLPTL